MIDLGIIEKKGDSDKTTCYILSGHLADIWTCSNSKGKCRGEKLMINFAILWRIMAKLRFLLEEYLRDSAQSA